MNAPAADNPVSLLERIKSREEGAWEEFASRYSGVLERWCQKWCISKDDRQDVIQDALLEVLIGIPKFERQRVGSFRAWMKTIAWRCWCDALAKSERLKDLDLIYKLRESPDAYIALEQEFDRIAEEELLRASVERVRDRVEERTWDAFRLTALENRPAADVAELLGMQVNSIYAARCRVQKLIAQECKRLDAT